MVDQLKSSPCSSFRHGSGKRSWNSEDLDHIGQVEIFIQASPQDSHSHRLRGENNAEHEENLVLRNRPESCPGVFEVPTSHELLHQMSHNPSTPMRVLRQLLPGLLGSLGRATPWASWHSASSPRMSTRRGDGMPGANREVQQVDPNPPQTASVHESVEKWLNKLNSKMQSEQ